MSLLLQLKHWKLFIVLITLLVVVLLLQEGNFELGNIKSEYITISVAVIYLITLFGLSLNIGLFLNKISVNPFRFNNGLMIFSTLCCILGYSELNLSKLYFGQKPIPPSISLILTILTFFGIIYLFRNVSKSLKSMELGREAVAKEYILDAILLFLLPIGIWFIQPRVNRLFNQTKIKQEE